MSLETFPLDIVPDKIMAGVFGLIAIPKATQDAMGVSSEQFIRFGTGSQELLLRVITLDTGTEARVSKEVFEQLEKLGQKPQFSLPPITLGCDPEFFIVHGQRFVNANPYLPFFGQVGSDQGLGELRPNYGTHESKVVENLRNLVLQIPTSVERKARERGLSYEGHSFFSGLSAGFHVHLGLPKEMLNTRREFHIRAMDYLVKTLDWYVSTLLVPLEPDQTRRCGRAVYGLPGDYRPSNITLEYRTPGGFYLRTPTLAAGLLGTCLLVTEHVVNKLQVASDNFVRLNKLLPGDLQKILEIPRSELIQHTLMEESKATATRAIPRILEDLRAMPEYPRHQRSVEEFAASVKAGFQPSPNLVENWRK